jgi:mannosylglycoprotein endo-beta-mannosidase
MPIDKAPGPDGYTGNFFRACWDIIKEDMVVVFNSINNLRCANMSLLNSANIILIPKKEGAEEVKDFRPISLIHSVAKILAKLLALRLRPHMRSLISVNQSTFIKGRSIHDNFLYVRNLARRYHRTRRPMLLFKLDITKAFDSVRWDYLVALLQHHGFPQKWRDWISFLLSTSTSQVLLNGIPGSKIQHGRGLRQGDPLLPLLFILAIDPLQWLLSKATELNAISKLRGRAARLRISMYADDAVVFLNPIRKDVQTFSEILFRFGQATGLVANMQKSQVAPIRCGNIDLDSILNGVPAVRANFPLKYLGLPLLLGRMRKADIQSIFDKIAARVTGWRGKNMGPAGRSTLVKSVMTTQPIYLLTALKVSKEALGLLDAKRRRFLWAGTGDITGEKCKVNWEKTCLPTVQGGLGILNMEKFARALRLRWLWHEWKDPAKPWVGLETPCDKIDKILLAAATKITIGDGHTIRFWDSAWMDGQRPKDIMPLAYAVSKKKRITLQEGLENDAWIEDLNLNGNTPFTVDLIDQLVALWDATQGILLDQNEPDQITWKLSVHGEYSASSAYKAQCLGTTGSNFNTLIWRTRALAKCKFYAWLVIQNRVWTSDRLAARGWPNNGTCPLCHTKNETAVHLLAHCRFSRRI